MHSIKQLIMGAALGAGMLLGLGCSNFLEQDPQGVETEENFFKTADQAQRATTAIYDVLGWEESGEKQEWFIGDVCSDDAEKGGEGPGDIGELQQLKDFAATADNPILGYAYKEPYVAIRRANQVIANVPGIEMDAELQAQLIAEAKFLRAYFYFKLARIFGGVPLILAPQAAGEYCQPRATDAQVYAQIVKDLTEAQAVLPLKSELSEVGRASKGAAQAMLCKVNIYRANWVLAEAWADSVIASGEYGLEPNYADIFTKAKENGLESIFEIQHLEIPTGDWGNDNEGQVTTIFQGMREGFTINPQDSSDTSWTYFPGWGFNLPTESLFKEYEAGDVRRDATILKVGDTLYKGTDAQQIIWSLESPTGMHNKKCLLEYQGASTPDMSNAPANWRVFRYADLLLFKAEAANENGKLAIAKQYVDLVRGRVHLDPVVAADKAAMSTAILHERRCELAMEGHRYFDMIRTGNGSKLSTTYSETKRLMPIPQIELDVCSELTQNPY
jgi:hypothetical protein